MNSSPRVGSNSRAERALLLSALWDYCRTEAFPRLRQIVVSTEALLALAAGVLFAIFGAGAGVGRDQTGDVILVLLAYAAIGFGFSVAGLTLVLTAPDRQFAAQLAWTDPGQATQSAQPPTKNSYANLLFIFSWTAVAHWLVVVASFALLLSLGKDAALLADGSSVKHRVAVGVVAAATTYAVELFLVTVITLAQVGASYIERLHRARPPE